MGRMKEVFMEVYQKYEGNIPYDMTLKDFVAQAEQYKKERELEELRDEQEIKRKSGTQVVSKSEETDDNV
jgi:hypothetical protein